MSDFGTSFVNAYNATSQTLEAKKRTALAESAEKRAQEEWELKKADLKEITDLTHGVAADLQESQDKMVKWARDKTGAQTPAAPAAQAGVGPPSLDAQGQNVYPRALSPDPGVYPRPPAPGAAVGLQPSPTAEVAPAVPPAAPARPGLNISATDDATAHAAATAADKAGQQVTATLPPAPGAASAAPAPPDVPYQPGVASAAGGPTYADHIDNARQTMNKITPKLVQILAKSNPAEAAKYAAIMADSGVQDRLVKTQALASLMETNPRDPAIAQLLPQVFPGARGDTWMPHPPDKDGNVGYGQFTMDVGNGQTAEIPVNPASIRATLTSTLSAKGILDEHHKGIEEVQKTKETDAYIKAHEAATQQAKETLAETIREHKAGDEERHARTGAYAESAAATAAARTATAADRKEAGEAKRRKEGIDAIIKTSGATPAMLAAEADQPGGGPITNGLSERIGAADAIAKENDIPQDGSSMPRLAAYYQQWKGGNSGGLVRKDGKFFFDTGTGEPLKVPPSALPPEILRRLNDAGVTSAPGKKLPGARGLQQ